MLAASEGSGEAATPNSPSEGPQSTTVLQVRGGSDATPILASALAGSTASIVSADVALDASEPVVGSFTADGLTYAVGDGEAILVAASSDLQQITDLQDADDSRVAPVLAPGQVAIPETVTYNGTTYPVTSVGSYAFYLSGATSVALPASVLSVDDRAFRSSEVARAEVDSGNPSLASYDGALYSADLSRLLLIPGGRGGAVRIPDNAEEVPAAAFSHCAQVDAVSVDGGSPAFSSWEGLLYSADGTTLLRVPAGATEITIRDGCMAIAAGAMEGCAKLERINAPASVTSISPDLFESVPTVSLPAQMAVQDGTNPGVASGLPDQVKESADSVQAEGEAEASPRRVVASSQGGGVEEAEGAFGSEVPTSPQPPSASSAESADTVASSLLDQTKESTDFIPQLTAMVALSLVQDDVPEVDPSSITVVSPEEGNRDAWTQLGMRIDAAEEVREAQSSTAYGATRYDFSVDTNGGVGYSSYTNQTWTGRTGFPSDQPGNTSTAEARVYARLAGNLQYGSFSKSGDTLAGWCRNDEKRVSDISPINPNDRLVAIWNSQIKDYPITYEINPKEGSHSNPPSYTYSIGVDLTAASPEPGFRFDGWTCSSSSIAASKAPSIKPLTTGALTFTANFTRVDFDLGFDTDSEPGDIDYPGEAKPDEAINKDSGAVEIEDPKRPGYVFEGWVIPNADGTEAVDQDFVYQGDDGKWYVDASKLPDYANDDGKVELTARWTSVISVDVPSSVTFYADLVTQGQESREGAASSAFGQNQVSNQSQVDLRVVGLESSAVKTTDSTLGADSVLKKADAATPSSSTQKLLSLYPSAKQWTTDELQDPDAVGGSKAATAVDFDLDDILLEKSFKADDFTIAAGGTLNMGYRLNLAESGQQLDYDKLSTLSEGQSASIANVSYCFAADALPSDWDEPLWVENPDRTSNPAKYLLLDDIKQAADDLSANGTASEYYATYKGLLDAQVTDNGTPGAGPYFQLKVDGVYLPLQLIGICQDTKSDGTGKAGLTFHVRDVYAFDTTGSNGTFDCRMFHSNVGADAGGWANSTMRANLRTGFLGRLDAKVANSIVPVVKRQQLGYGATLGALQATKDETIWLPSVFEVYGVAVPGYGTAEGPDVAAAYVPFQYEAYKGNSGSYTNSKALKMGTPPMDGVRGYWLRSCNCGTGFSVVNGTALCTGDVSTRAYGVAPAFCL